MDSEKIIVFDGFCNLCSGLVNFLIKVDRKKQFSYIPSQSVEGISLIKKFHLDEVGTSIYFIDGKKVFDRSQAIFHIASSLGMPYIMILIFGVFGRPINDGLYQLVSKSRFKIFGKRNTCRLPIKKTSSEIIP